MSVRQLVRKDSWEIFAFRATKGRRQDDAPGPVCRENTGIFQSICSGVPIERDVNAYGWVASERAPLPSFDKFDRPRQKRSNIQSAIFRVFLEANPAVVVERLQIIRVIE
jgi:hypothetical protein